MLERRLSHLSQVILTSPPGLALFHLVKILQNWRRGPQPWFEVVRLDLDLPRLGQAFDGYRMVQLSDFHLGTWINRERLEEVVDCVNQLQPDLIVLTGDYVTFQPKRFMEDLRKPLSRLTAPDGKMAILGNHDHWTDAALVRKMLKEAEILDLSNAVHTLQRGRDCLHIAGVDDVIDQQDRLDQVLQQLPEDGAAVLLAHEPDFADQAAATGRFDLQLSGHSHGGQIRLPNGAFLFLPMLCRKYPSGRYSVGNLIQYTNRGLGTGEVQIRWNATPEISLICLHPLV